jgi:hypothetical protein
MSAFGGRADVKRGSFGAARFASRNGEDDLERRLPNHFMGMKFAPLTAGTKYPA